MPHTTPTDADRPAPATPPAGSTEGRWLGICLLALGVLYMPWSITSILQWVRTQLAGAVAPATHALWWDLAPAFTFFAAILCLLRGVKLVRAAARPEPCPRRHIVGGALILMGSMFVPTTHWAIGHLLHALGVI